MADWKYIELAAGPVLDGPYVAFNFGYHVHLDLNGLELLSTQNSIDFKTALIIFRQHDLQCENQAVNSPISHVRDSVDV